VYFPTTFTSIIDEMVKVQRLIKVVMILICLSMEKENNICFL
jgi:hypothetical protein